MSYLTAVLLGLVQGVAEFLPISSSGHLALLQNIFGVEEADLLFDVLLHLGTLTAIVMTYRRDLRAIVRGGLGLVGIGPDRGRTTKKNADRRRMAVFIVVGSLPLLLVLPVRGAVENLYHSTVLVSLMLMVTGGMLYLTDRLSVGTKGLRDVSLWQVLLVGLGQALAVLPGISRSGATISIALACGFRKKFAVRYSFLLSVPAVLCATLLTLAEAASAGMNFALLPQYLCGMVAAAVSGYFSIRLLRYLAEKSSFGGFAYYCWGAGIIALMLSLIA
jgi:undecaprenyl-diphosphatase